MSDGSHTYTYDAEGNVTQVDGGSTAKYTYNPLNERVRIDLGGSSSEEFIFDPFGDHTSAHDAIHNWAWADWIYWGDSSARVAVDTDSQTNFDHQDWEGTERAVTLYNGQVEGSYSSLPWGDGYSVSGSDIDPYHFAMLDRDSTSDTDHAQFRQYGNTQGRWMSPDPYSGSYDPTNPQSMNRYSYVINSPMAYLDPWGLEICVVVGGDTWSISVDGSPQSSGSDSGSYACTSDPSDGSTIPYVGSGGGGAPNNGFKNNQQITNCVKSFYNSKLGKAVQFGSPLSLLPVWNPGYGNNLKEWGVAIVGKSGGLFGSGATPGTNQLTTLSGTKTVGSVPELATEGTLGAVEKISPYAMGAATLVDIMAHNVCAASAYPTPSVPSPF